ncbi:nicotinate (nicotinamide) nucleotide adenylyltransferase [Candidatus Pelagibacter sp.]|nr:nicotinate (nicotinamide) nucleotide adenylyltransferase [Candidatus Pelagibacter sp.]
MEKFETKLKIKKVKIGILGGSFDPAHKGHLAISKDALKRFNLKSIIWAITNQNPFKEKTADNLKRRIIICKKVIGTNRSIKVKFFEDIINSNKTADLINHLSKNKKYDLFFLMGADNLINFHKWYKWKQILKKSNIIVFDRNGYKKKSLNSKAYKSLNEKQVTFVKFDKVNISSSKLRKI